MSGAIGAQKLGALLTELNGEADAEAWAALEYADECVTLAEIDATELDRAESALVEAERLGRRAGILPEGP